MHKTKIRSFRKRLRVFERLTAQQLKAESCCHGVTLAQCHTILEIEDLGQATIAALTRQLGLDKSTLSRTIDGLVNIGLVQRETHLTDRRFNRLSLTLKGQAVADRINQANDGFYGRVFRDIGNAKLDDVIENFERLVTAMRNLQDRKN